MEPQAERVLRYRSLAEEIRSRADASVSHRTRDILLRLATDYEKLASALEPPSLERG